MITQLLIPTWRGESKSLILNPGDGKPGDSDGKDKADPCAASVSSLPRHIRNAEELVCLVYMAFIQNVLGRLRSLVMGIICMFIAIAVAIASYPFDPRPLLSGIVVILFAILGHNHRRSVFADAPGHDAQQSNLHHAGRAWQ